MRLYEYVKEDSMFDLVKEKSVEFLKKKFKEAWPKFVDEVRKAGKEQDVLSIVNRNFKTKYRSFDDINVLKESRIINEGWSDWWKIVRTEAFPTLAFYPALTTWLEIDKLFDGSNPNWKKIAFYSVFWLFLVSAKYLKGKVFKEE